MCNAEMLNRKSSFKYGEVEREVKKRSLNTWLSALICLYLAAAEDRKTSKMKSVYVAVAKCRGSAGIDV